MTKTMDSQNNTETKRDATELPWLDAQYRETFLQCFYGKHEHKH